MLLFGVGVGSTFIPGLPPATINPDLVLTLFLPPLLYASTVRVTWHLLRFTFWPGVVLGAALVLVTIAAVAAAVRTFLLPGLGWPVAILVGMVAAFFDTRLFHEAKGRLRVPRPISDTLKARELVGRILVLATLGLVEDQMITVGSVPWHLIKNFAIAIPVGILVGLAVGHASVLLRRKIDPAPIEIAVSIATPYAATLIASLAGVSIAAAVITSALVISAVRVNRASGATIFSSEARINATAFWEEASLMLSSGLLLLAGRAVPGALQGLELWPAWQAILAAAAALAIALTVQFGFAIAATRMAPISATLLERRTSSWGAAAVMTWSSTRSVIALLIALSIPTALPGGAPFEQRNLLLALATLIVIGSVVIQGLSLPYVIKRAGLADVSDDEEESARALAAMRDDAASRDDANGSGTDAARQRLLRMREDNSIGDEVMTSMMREVDLAARAAEKDALPGAGTPQP
jgi:CPA1 family monovalent cation:H+ antiporter